MTLQVPQTAWLVARNGGVSVHALTSGSYEVGVQCLTSISGCALRPAEAKVAIKLKAPKPRRCVRGRRCETMTVGPSTARVGDEVMVSGWAPVQDLIGPSFSYSISVTPGSARATYPALAYSASKLAGSFNVVLTPTRVRIGPSPPWAKLGDIHSVSSTYSGPSAIDLAPNSSRVAWCETSGIVATGGSGSGNDLDRWRRERPSRFDVALLSRYNDHGARVHRGATRSEFSQQRVRRIRRGGGREYSAALSRSGVYDERGRHVAHSPASQPILSRRLRGLCDRRQRGRRALQSRQLQ